MFEDELERHDRLAANLQRALVVDPHPPAARAVAELLQELTGCQIWTARDEALALPLAGQITPHLILAARRPQFDGAALIRTLRRSDAACRQAPAIVYGPDATAAALVASRDAGAHEFVRLPVTRSALGRHLESAVLRPREWVEGISYVGPDRRRFNCGDYDGALRRRIEHAATREEARIVQAIRIVRAALAAMESDPQQALRAMRAQAETLRAIAETRDEPALRTQAEALTRKLATASPRHLRVARIEPLVAPLLAYAPNDLLARKAA